MKSEISQVRNFASHRTPIKFENVTALGPVSVHSCKAESSGGKHSGQSDTNCMVTTSLALLWHSCSVIIYLTRSDAETVQFQLIRLAQVSQLSVYPHSCEPRVAASDVLTSDLMFSAEFLM